MSPVRTALLVAALAAAGAAQWVDAAQKPKAYTAPEAFTSPLQAHSKSGSAAATIRIQIDRYTPEHARTTMTDGLKYNGYPGFLRALRDAPPAGTLTVAGQEFKIRWARQVPNEKGRTISLVTDKPVFFIGMQRKDAPPTAGYEVAVVQLVFDSAGKGTGTMAAAARVKRDGETGVKLDTYADNPLTLTATVRSGR